MPPPPGPSGGVTRSGPRLPVAARSRPAQAPAAGRSQKRRRRGKPLTLSLYIGGEILQVFGVALAAIVLLYITVIAFQLVRDGLRLDFVWSHLLRTMAYPLFFAIPLALLFGITLGIGRMAHDHELTAMQVQGVSHRELAAPVAIVALACAGLNYYLSGWVLPEVHYEQANLRETILAQLDHLGSGTNRTLLLPGNVSLFVKRYEGSHLERLVLDIPQATRAGLLPELGAIGGESVRRHLLGNTGKITLVARESNLEVAADKSRVTLWLSGVSILMPEEVSGPRGLDVFHQKYSIDKLPLPLSFARRGESAKDMKTPDLARWIGGMRERLRALGEEIRVAGAGKAAGGGPSQLPALKAEQGALERRLARAEIERQGRLTFSLACITFPFFAFPLVMLLWSRGRLAHFFLGNLAVVVVFFPLVMAGHLAADRGWPAALAMLLPNLALALGGGILYRAMVLR